MAHEKKLKSLLTKFAKSSRSRIINMFELVRDRRSAGFEKWVQWELASYLNQNNIKPTIEHPVSAKSSSEKNHFMVDLKFEYWGQEFGVELKTKNLGGNAVSSIIEDIGKFKDTTKGTKLQNNFSVVLCNKQLSGANESRLSQHKIDWLIVPVDKANDIYLILAWKQTAS